MRTTLDIDDDILGAAKELARAEGKTAGQVISDLARKALTRPQAGFAETQAEYGNDLFPVFPTLPNRTGRIVTTEQIKRMQLETELEDGIPWDHAADKPRGLDNDDKQR